MGLNNHYVVCSICGAPGHKAKSCSLYRLNEQQSVVSGKHAEVAQAKTN